MGGERYFRLVPRRFGESEEAYRARIAAMQLGDVAYCGVRFVCRVETFDVLFETVDERRWDSVTLRG